MRLSNEHESIAAIWGKQRLLYLLIKKQPNSFNTSSISKIPFFLLNLFSSFNPSFLITNYKI
uniref:Uncharacterized protein n=1 Tax=Helianthus annuus TaxID=4232 RepID=A0A251TRB3_HELAN